MSRPLVFVAPIALAIGLVSACAGDASRDRRVLSVPWVSSEVRGAGEGGATWAYLPEKPSVLDGALVLDGKKVLYFGKRGERWLRDEASGEIEAAGDLAEQDLVGLARPSSGGFRFVGKGGAVFEAASPLGNFTRVIAPAEPLARVDASGSGVAAVTRAGRLLLSRDGSELAPIKPFAPFIADVAWLDGNNAIALAFPERLFATKDAGSTWSVVDAPTVGANRLVRTRAGEVTATGFRQSLILSDRPPELSTLPAKPVAFTLPFNLAPAPGGADFRAGRAFLHRGMSFVARSLPKVKGWTLGRAKLGERLASSPLEGTNGCASVALAGDDRALWVACSSHVRGSSLAAVKILRFKNIEEPPEELDAALEGPLGEARIAIRGDRLLASGVCRARGSMEPGRSREAGGACDPDVPLLLTRWRAVDAAPAPAPSSSAAAAPSPSSSASADPVSPFLAVTAPGLLGRPLAMAFSASEKSAYFLGRRAKTGNLAIFVSHDGGRSFESRELDLTAGAREGERRAAAAGLTFASISTLEEGVVSAAFEGLGTSVVVADEDGRALTVSSPPTSSASTRIGLAGRRGLAVDGPAVFETLDGGVSWRSLGDFGALRCDKPNECVHPVSCAPEGCIIGRDVSRIGWGGATDPRRVLTPDTTPFSPAFGRSNPPPFVCRLGKEKWMPLPKGVVPLGGHGSAGTADSADRGKTPWATFAEDPLKGSVTMVHGAVLPAVRVEEVALFAPTPNPASVAVKVVSQIEGAAAIRYNVGGAASPAAPALRAEVAWENLFESKVFRATLPDLGRVTAGGFHSQGPNMANQADDVDLLSVTSGGMFVVMNGHTVFVDGRSRVEKTPAQQFPTQSIDGIPFGGRLDGVRVDGKSVMFTVVHATHQAGRDPHTLGLFRSRAGTVDALAIGPLSGGPFAVESGATSFSYLNGQPLFVALSKSEGAWSIGLFPFRADGDVLGPRTEGPTQTAAVEKFRACTAADRAKTPRVVAPPDTGTRRGIIIEGPDGARFTVMASSSMVLYGTADAPCVGAIDAVPVREDDNAPGGEETDRALVMTSDLEHGWFFRAGVNEGIETRTMRCKVDPNASLPLHILRAIDDERDQPTKRTRVRASGGRKP